MTQSGERGVEFRADSIDVTRHGRRQRRVSVRVLDGKPRGLRRNPCSASAAVVKQTSKLVWGW